MKILYFLLLCFAASSGFGQVGINTADPKAQLEIKSSSETTPAITDGLLIPKVNSFPVSNPTIDQQGMLVYLQNSSGADQPGFYYWNFPTLDWIPIVTGASGGTLDQAYDFGGAGLGKTITADAGAVVINGTDGWVSTGTFGSGATAPSGAGTRMVWSPRKGAFRAGRVLATAWDHGNIGDYSIAMGDNNLASGLVSVAFGSNNEATGNSSTAFGISNQTTGSGSTAFGNANVASGNFSTAFGQTTFATGSHSTVFGIRNNAKSYGEMALGIGATDYTVSTNGATQFRLANAGDRLFVIGNAIDSNSNNSIDTAEQSDALIILKNGLTRLPSTTNAMITAADGKAVVTKEYLQNNTSGTLDQAYDFGGPGLGRTITADTGAVLINGGDGLISTGTVGSGAIIPSGGGTRMVWNPRKGAFRAGSVNTNAWDDVNVGLNSAAFGASNYASGFGSVAFGTSNNVSGVNAVIFGSDNFASGTNSTSFGSENSASGTTSTAFGFGNLSRSYGETVFGIGATDYTASVNGAFFFRTANATDRLFVVGNGIDANSNNVVDFPEKSDALIILKNGLTRLPSTTNAMITAADGKAVVTKEFLQSNTTAWGLSGNAATNPTANFIGTNDDIDVVFKRFNTRSGLLGPTNTSFGFGALTSVTTGTSNTATGVSALASNTVGRNNSATGRSALSLNTSGNENTANGAFSLQNNTSGNNNTASGFEVLRDNTTGINNTANGSHSLRANTTGRNNSATGRSALLSNTTGNENTAMGAFALEANTTGNNNSALGSSALLFNTTGSNNTATGFFALLENIVGDYNTANGVSALSSNTDGDFNTGIGADALLLNSTGNHNTANGYEALRNTTIGDNNTANGSQSLRNNTTGRNNTASGRLALSSNTTGNENTATGVFALQANTTGTNNTATGTSSLLFSTTGSNNTATGAFALFENTIGGSNTATGSSALSSNTTGGNNTANGVSALSSNTTGTNNSASGYQSLMANTTGTNNTAMGVLALDSNTTGIDNTAFGRAALTDNVTGGSNTAIGRDALFNSVGDNNTALGRGTLSGVTTGSNNTAIGFNAQVANAANNNQVRVGNTAVTLASVQVAWTVTSDRRWKSNIQKSNLGLDFIKQLNPVFYTRKDVEVKEGQSIISEKTSDPTTEYGFIAQEIESTLTQFDAQNNGIISKDDTGMYGVRYNDLIAPMVKAIQEQQIIIEGKSAENTALKAEIEKQNQIILTILSRLDALENKN